MKLELTLESPYTADGEPRADLPTGEVLAWDGEYWITGMLQQSEVFPGKVDCVEFENGRVAAILFNIKRFAPLPTKIEDESTIF